MSNISSINFKKSTAWQIYHNDKHRPGYAIGGEVLCRPNADEALKIKQDIINKAIEAYNKNKKPKAPPFKAKSYEWSAVVNLKPKPTQELYKDLEKLAQHFQEKYGYQCYQIAIHEDEGHINENGEKELNLHAHLEFITLDKKTGRNKFNRRDNKYQTMRDMQTETAEILGMERGIDKRLSGAKRIEPRVWAKMKEQEKGERKATREKIKELENKNKELESEVRPLQMANNILKSTISTAKTALGVEILDEKTIKRALEDFRVNEMKNQGYTKDDFDKHSKLKKGILERFKLGENFTNEQIFKTLDDFKAELENTKAERDKERERANAAEQEIADLKKEIETLQKELDELRAKNAELQAQKQAKNDLIQVTPQEYEFLEKNALSPIEIRLNNLQKKEHPETQLNRVNFLKDYMQELETKAPNTFKTALQRYFENSKSVFENFVNACIANYKGLSKQSKQAKTQNTGLQR